MATTPYFNSNGLRVLTLPEVRDNMRESTESHSDLGAEASTGSNSLYGMFLDVVAAGIHDCYELVNDVWAGFDPDQAEGVAQDAVNRLRGAVRNPERYSTVELTLTATGACTVPAGSTVAIPNGGERFITDTAVVFGGAGSDTVQATAENPGPVEAAAGAITSIVTGVSGWSAVTNAAAIDADEMGEDVETSTDYRLRSEDTALGSTTEEAVYTRISELDDVDAVVVLSNRDPLETDSDGIDPGEAWIIVHPSTADADGIAEAIWGTAGVGFGMGMKGSQTATVEDASGETETIAWDWATAADVHAYVGVTTDSDYPATGDDLIEAIIIEYFATLGVGDDVYPAQIAGAVIKGVGDLAAVPGIKTIVVGVKLGSTAGAGDTSPLDLDINEYPDLDETDVVVVST